MELISISDFVLEHKNLVNKSSVFDFATLVVNYSEFLKQPLKLSMFVPCDENGNPLEKPNCDCLSEYDREYCPDKCWMYINAINKVLFKDFEFHKISDDWSSEWLVRNPFIKIYDYEFGLSFNVEYLSNKLPTIKLTESAIKQWNLS